MFLEVLDLVATVCWKTITKESFKETLLQYINIHVAEYKIGAIDYLELHKVGEMSDLIFSFIQAELHANVH